MICTEYIYSYACRGKTAYISSLSQLLASLTAPRTLSHTGKDGLDIVCERLYLEDNHCFFLTRPAVQCYPSHKLCYPALKRSVSSEQLSSIISTLMCFTNLCNIYMRTHTRLYYARDLSLFCVTRCQIKYGGIVIFRFKANINIISTAADVR